MTLRNADRCRDTSTTTGTGNITVSGSAPQSFITFSAIPGITVGDTFWLIIANQSANEYESTLGTWQGSNVISRAATPYQSSNSGALVNFSAGTKDVFIAPISSQISNVPGTRVLLNTLTASNSAALQDTTSLTASYKYYEIIFDNLLSSASTPGILGLQVYVGAAYQTTGYTGAAAYTYSAAAPSSVPSTSNIILSAGPLSTTIYTAGRFTVASPSSSSLYKLFHGTSTGYGSSGYVTSVSGGSFNTNTNAVTGFQIYYATGNITSGTVAIYGWN